MTSLLSEDLKPYCEAQYYLEKSEGKQVRERFIEAFAQWMQSDVKQTSFVKDVINALHNVSLLYDDIEDHSRLRRGVPCAHLIYGYEKTINSANIVCFQVFKRILEEKNAKMTNAFVEELLSLHDGQGYDIYWRDSYTCPTEEQYRQMVINKTGGLLRLAVRLLQSFTNESRNYITLVENFALYFQIRDDYVNLQSEEYMAQKSYCEDFTEGKFSFPIIHAIRSNPDDQMILNVLRKRTEDKDIKQFAVKLMEQKGSFSYTLNVLTELWNDIQEEIALLGSNEILETIMQKLRL